MPVSSPGFVRCLRVVIAVLGVVAIASAAVARDSVSSHGTDDRDGARGAARGEAAATPRSAEEIEQLVRQLGDDRFERREAAQSELAKLGFAAHEALQAARNDADPEIASRVRYLLRLMRVDLTRPDDSPEVAALLANFTYLKEPEQLQRLEQLASLKDAGGIPALCRVIMHEPSVVLAKEAALAIMKAYPTDEVGLDRLAKLLRENLRSGGRPPSKWMLTFAKLHDAPDEAWREWDEWTRREEELLKQEDQDTNKRVVTELVTRQVDWISRTEGNSRRMTEKMRAMYQARRPAIVDPTPLIAWLVERKAWEVFGVLPSSFAEQLAANPNVLVYQLAKRYADGGKTELAEAAAEKAFGFDDGMPGRGQWSRSQIGYLLQSEGRFAWAEREYRRVIESGKPHDEEVYEATMALVEMLHDQQDDLRAAGVLEKVVAGLKEQPKTPLTNLRLRSLMAKMDYHLACHWERQGDRRKQFAYLDAGLAIDPTSIDLLILGYRLSADDELRRQKIENLIKEAIDQLRLSLLTGTDRGMASNNLAWLLASTERNLDEAIRLSRQSLAEQPETGGYHDTLARCYQAKGDFEEAVRHQIKAVELEPHSGQIARHLETIRKQYEEKRGKPAPKPEQPVKRSLMDEMLDPQLGPTSHLRLDDPFPME